jgi:hypothetical protein
MIEITTPNDGRLDQLASIASQLNDLLGFKRQTRKPSGGIWKVTATSSGTDKACSNGTTYLGRFYLPAPALATGAQYLIGSVGGTNNVILTLYDETGRLLRATASTLVGTALNVQQIPFATNGSGAAATTLQLEPGYYWIGLTANGTTAKFRAVPDHGGVGDNVLGGTVTQTFGTITSTVTVPTTLTADTAPVASLY